MNIRTLRKARGLTQVQLAKMLDPTQKVVHPTRPTSVRQHWRNLKNFPLFFDVSIDEIVGKKKMVIENEQIHLHGNRRTARVQELFDKLPPSEQRLILKQIQALVTTNGKQES